MGLVVIEVGLFTVNTGAQPSRGVSPLDDNVVDAFCECHKA